MPTKKYMFFMLIAFFIGVLLFSKADAHIDELPLLGRVIFVDPGHPSYLFPNVMV